MTIPSLSVANSARSAANRQRAAALIAVADPEQAATVTDVISAACTVTGRPLLRITLRQLLLAQPGWGPDRTGKVLEQTMATLEKKSVDPRKLTISWLLDHRAGGKRFMAFCDALYPRTSTPWAGYPFAPKPSTVTQQNTRAS